MIQNTNKKFKIIFYLLFFTLFSCKKISSEEKEKNITEHIITEEKKKVDTWKFVKTFSLSPQSNYSCDYKKYENIEFGLSKDSIFINGKYTDDIYTNLISSEDYFDQQYLFEAYKKRLNKELGISFPMKIKSIRNKKAYDEKSLLNNYFEDAFFIDSYMFFDDNGCIVCFKKVNLININKNIKSISSKDFEISNTSFPEVNKTIIVNDNQANTVYQLHNNIYVAWFDGDSEKWYLITYKDNKPVSQLLIGKSETIESENGIIDNYIDFKIDENFKVTLEYSTGKNIGSKTQLKLENYQINLSNNKIEKL